MVTERSLYRGTIPSTLRRETGRVLTGTPGGPAAVPLDRMVTPGPREDASVHAARRKRGAPHRGLHRGVIRAADAV